ncbi:MAG: oligosaccharide flippase family protein [Pseudomonadota bacterium]
MTKVSTLGAARIFAAGLGLVTQILLARALGASDLGLVYIVMSAASVLALVCGLGFPSVTIRFIAQYRAEAHRAAADAFMRFSRITSYTLLGVVMTVGLVAILVSGNEDQGIYKALLLGLTAACYMALRLNGALANADRHFNLAYLPTLLGKPVIVLAGVALMMAGAVGMTALGFLAIHLIGVVLLAAWQAWRVRNLRRATFAAEMAAGARWETRPPLPKRRTWLKPAVTMLPVALFTAMFADACILAAAPFLAPSDLAVFGICLKLAFLVGFAIQVVSQVVLPDAADAVFAEDKHELRRLMRLTSWFGAGIAMVALASFAILGEFVLSLFGDDFTPGWLCLLVLAASQVMRGAMGPGSYLLAISGGERHTIPLSILGVLLLVGLTAGLAPAYGLTGAAIAVLATQTIWSAALAVSATRHTGVSPALI